MKKLLGVLTAAGVALGALAGTAAQAQTKNLVFLAADVPISLNLDGRAGTHFGSQTAWVNLYEPLLYHEVVGRNEEGIEVHDFNRYVSRLAESWSFDDKTLTWTFKLRRGVKGCDGSTFNADDIIYTFARGKSLTGASGIAFFLSEVASIAGFDQSVRAARRAQLDAQQAGRPVAANDATKLGEEIRKIDDYTVQFKQSAANKLFLPVLTIYSLRIMDKETMEKHATADDPWSHKYVDQVNGPSFGAYCLDKWTPEQEFRVKANKDYYGKKPYFDNVIMRRVPQSSNRLAILRTGQAQMTENLTPQEFESLRNVKGVKVGGHYLNNTLIFLANWKAKPLDNIKVRQALAHAIPYDEVLRVGYNNTGKKWNGHVPSLYPGYHKPTVDYDYNPAKAKQLLAEAGYPDGKGLEAFGNSFLLGYNADREGILGRTATVLQTELGKVGFPIKLDPLPPGQIADRLMVKKDLALGLYDLSRPIGVDAVYAMLLYFVSSEKGGLLNMTNYANPRVDELYKLAQLEGNEQKRNEYLAEAQEILQKELAWISVAEYKTQWAFNDKIKGIAIHPDNNVRWAELRMD